MTLSAPPIGRMSTAGVVLYPPYAGLLMNKEIEVLRRCIKTGRRVDLGGAKVSDKINVVRRF